MPGSGAEPEVCGIVGGVKTVQVPSLAPPHEYPSRLGIVDDRPLGAGVAPPGGVPAMKHLTRAELTIRSSTSSAIPEGRWCFAIVSLSCVPIPPRAAVIPRTVRMLMRV